MPIWRPSLIAAGFEPDTDPLAVPPILEDDALNADFLLHAGPIGDILPIPIPFIRNVASIGDLFLSAGLGFFLFATVLRSPAEAIEEDAAGPPAAVDGDGRTGRPRSAAASRRPTSGGGSDRRAASHRGSRRRRCSTRPILLGGPRCWPVARLIGGRPPVLAFRHRCIVGRASPSPGRAPRSPSGLGRHPYVRLALNCSFSALWVGQLISLFGDRIHQIALAFLVLAVTDSPIAVAFVFVVATPAEPVPLADRRNVRRPLGPEGRHGRQRPAARGDHP